jgi:hypothetical protein
MVAGLGTPPEGVTTAFLRAADLIGTAAGASTGASAGSSSSTGTTAGDFGGEARRGKSGDLDGKVVSPL